MSNVCSLCGMGYNGYGHNAAPLSDDRCCDWCNNLCVLPARLELLLGLAPSEPEPENENENESNNSNSLMSLMAGNDYYG